MKTRNPVILRFLSFCFTGKTGTNILQKATVPILSDAECLQWHEHKNINLELHSEMFCAGHSDGHMDACLVSLMRHDLLVSIPQLYRNTDGCV